MAQLNVFDDVFGSTFKELSESRKKTTTKSNKKKVVKESAKFKKCRTPKKISYNKIKLESLRFAEDAEENGEVVDYTPTEDVVLVIDPEMEETPETVEDAEDAAEELVGDYVCKCSICGANYVCDCEEVTEEFEVVDDVCPVCGESGEQIVVGEITPSDEVAEVEDDVDDTDTDSDEDVADDIEVDDEDVDNIDVDFDVDADTVDIDIEDEDEDADDFTSDEDDEYAESISRAKRKTALRRESKASMRTRKSARRTESRISAKKPMRRMSESKDYNLDEVTLNRMLTKFAKENYDNVRFVKITNAKCNRGKLTLEGTIVTKKGNKRATKFVCEGFKPTATITAKFTEEGAFTENAFSKGPSFIVDFRTTGNKITPVSLRYSYKVKEGREKFAVSGKVMNESIKRTSVKSKRSR
jgi:hypothetical protein